MRLKKARVTSYRSIRDTGWIDFESDKTILVGPNESGKSAILKALQQINAPADAVKFDPLRDYPRADYNDITRGRVEPAKTVVVEAHFELEPEDAVAVGAEFGEATYVLKRWLDNKYSDEILGAPPNPTLGEVRKDLARLVSHIDGRVTEKSPTAAEQLAEITKDWEDEHYIQSGLATELKKWLQSRLTDIDEQNEKEEERYDRLLEKCDVYPRYLRNKSILHARLPIFVLFSNYHRVRPLIHLAHLAKRIDQNLLDDDQYDYGNECLLRLLGFTAKELSELGNAGEPSAADQDAMKAYRDQLDNRSYQLNAASVRLTDEIIKVWNPNPDRAEANRLRITADGQYLKVVVEDELGVEIELDQRSEGFQWLVSFFVVFFAETEGAHENAILLLDEPGLSLHALKQRDFRETISILAKSNQTAYTTHSPFLVGPNELDLVRVVEMKDRRTGTKVHTTITAGDPAALLPLQEALGYDLAQSLFMQQRNLILEGLTDFWYLEATAELMRDGGFADLNRKIALISANAASKVVYYATILHAHNLKVAALLDSDAAGEQAARQDVLVNALSNKRILRTRDVYKGPVATPEIEDLLRDTLTEIAKSSLGWDVTAKAATQPKRPIVDLLGGEIPEFSKYKLAKAYVRWTRDNDAGALKQEERDQWSSLIGKINAAVK
ncbi:AAA family ATPase [Amaricoccus solimangrovi]|uniref:OLD family endonuclease n=1 Tax=Amaricoccus solimangrovi TaxID=2589815 RepID=A0A501WZD2_9RHOB|nr:AAA family ATPase [Amaricoccus solimangrovi]TPE53725.1 OLD family endonuclease [Amaricoccus solimangrovi]